MLETIIFTTVDLISFYWFPSELIIGHHFIIYLSQLVTSIFVKCFVEKVITHQILFFFFCLSRPGLARNNARMKGFFFFFFFWKNALARFRHKWYWSEKIFFLFFSMSRAGSARNDARMIFFFTIFLIIFCWNVPTRFGHKWYQNDFFFFNFVGNALAGFGHKWYRNEIFSSSIFRSVLA